MGTSAATRFPLRVSTVASPASALATSSVRYARASRTVTLSLMS